MNERFIYKGQLAEAQEEFRKVELLADSLLMEIRMKLNPTQEFCDFDEESVFTLIENWRNNQLKGRKLLEKIAELKSLLGI
jgi:hypothetical protein